MPVRDAGTKFARIPTWNRCKAGSFSSELSLCSKRSNGRALNAMPPGIENSHMQFNSLLFGKAFVLHRRYKLVEPRFPVA